MDGWSTAPLLNDLAALYRWRAGLSCSAPAELPVQYADYTLWQRELLGDSADTDSVYAQQLRYWRRALDGAPEILSLPSDRPRSAASNRRGSRVPLQCGATRYRRVLELARAHRCTPFMVVHAALAVLLTRVGAGSDLPIGTVVSGRTDEALNGLVGFFVNTLILRTDTSGDPGFDELLKRVRRADLDAYEHQELPFDLLVEELNPPRSSDHHPLFQVLLAFTAQAPARLDFGPVTATAMPADSAAAAKVDLTFQLTEYQDGHGAPYDLDGYVEFAEDLFDASTVESLCARLLRILDAVVEDPGIPINHIEVLTPAERHQVLVEWNATSRRLPVTTLPEALSHQAERSPDAIAVACGEHSLTYEELNTQAARVAAKVADVAAAGEVVAVALHRSVHMVVTLLAVLRAGCAYLPLDPEHPAGRTAHLISDAQPACVLTDQATRGELPNMEIPVVLVDEPSSTKPDEHVTRRPEPKDLAYVIYTSGSTGRPKGVMVSHAALDNRLRWMQGAYPLAADDRVLHKTPYGFDVSVWELFWPLREGATLVLAAPGEHRDPRQLARTIREQRVTVAHFVPSVLEQFLAETDADACSGLRRVVCSGEALSRQIAAAFHQALPSVALENLYGPTEAAIDVTAHSCSADERGPVAIGRPVWNTRVYVLDESLQPCPHGVPGELYLGGVQLAVGYMNRPALTASRFVADPYGPPGSRLYRTGDIVRWRHDGEIDYLGREDQQIKLYGQRIELGEIESLLAREGTVGSACVVVRSQGAADQRLVAYVTPLRDIAPDASSLCQPNPAHLREWLADRLPDAMMPTAFIVLDRLPLSPNGKLDRSALPDPRQFVINQGDRAPRTPQEKAIAGIFAGLLGVPAIGLDDNFFAHGGHSMLAIRLASQLRSLLGQDVPVQAIFRWPTVGALSRNLSSPDEGTSRDGTTLLLRLRSTGRHHPLFFVHPGTGLSWCYFRLLEDIAADWPVYALQAQGLSGRLDELGLPNSVEEMADDYIARIKEVQASGPYHLLGWSFGGLVAHCMATRLQQAGEQVDLLAAFDASPEPSYAVGREPEEHELLSEALRNLFEGAAHDSAGPEISEATVRELREFFLPLAEAEPSRVRATVHVGVNNVRLMSRFVPALFKGNLTLFTARRAPSPSNTLRQAHPAETWSQHVSGRVTVLPVDCDHYEMFSTASKEVGRLLSHVLIALVSRHPGSTEEAP
jgi:amino acid adenylation domain-containing protein